MLKPDEMLSAIGDVVRILAPLSSDDRRAVVQGVWVVLKENTATSASEEAGGDDGTVDSVAARARPWIRQNGITIQQLKNVFEIVEGSATVIASEVSGKNNSENTINTYVLAGLAGYLATGEPVFDDKTARTLCENFSCYDSSNHSKYMKEKGNSFTGSKESGWRLTAPGLKYGAGLLKQLAGSD